MFRKIKINDAMYEVFSTEEFNPKNSKFGKAAIDFNGIVYPYNNPSDYSNNGEPIAMINDTNNVILYEAGNDYINNPGQYSSNNIIDFNDVTNARELVQKTRALRNMENELLVDIDNIYRPPVRQNDSPEMAGFKNAISMKNIDIEKYKSRFGDNYGNDKRLIENSPTITFSKLYSFLDIFDMKATLILEDKSPDVPNPMGDKVYIDLE